MDKRKVRTQAEIMKTYLDIASTKPIDKISIVEITEQALISRKTFYLNFKNLDDLIHHIENQIIDNLFDFIRKFNFHEVKNNLSPILYKILKEITNTPIFIKFILSSNGDSILSKIKVNLINQIKLSYIEEMKENAYTYEVYIDFLVSGIIYSIKDWLEDTTSIKDCLGDSTSIKIDDFCNYLSNVIYSSTSIL